MRLVLLACLVLTACTNGDLEGGHLIVHVTCPTSFNAMMIHFGNSNPFEVEASAPTQSYDWDYWSTFDEETEVSITALDGAGNAVATGSASNIAYTWLDDGSAFAEISMRLTP